MGDFCILRTKKLKTDGNVGASLAHAFRERDTPNADDAKKMKNEHKGAKNKEQAMTKYRKLLPEKVRKNGVRCIEYLVTASPEVLRDMKYKDQIAYFNNALTFLRKMHGTENVFYAGIHFDEQTPHLYAYVVPIDKKGHLNCRSFLGGREKLTALQDAFYQEVGLPAGMQRGIKGSRAKHQTLKQYYGKIQAVEAAIAPPKRFLLENDEKYQERYKAQIQPILKISAETEQVKKRNNDLEEKLLDAKRYRQFIAGLTDEQKKEVQQIVAAKRQENQTLHKHSPQQQNDRGKSR